MSEKKSLPAPYAELSHLPNITRNTLKFVFFVHADTPPPDCCSLLVFFVMAEKRVDHYSIGITAITYGSRG